MMGTGTFQMYPCPSQEKDSGSDDMLTPPVKSNATPDRIVIVLNVTTKGLILRIFMIVPLRYPRNTPNASVMAIAMAGSIFHHFMNTPQSIVKVGI